MDRPTVYYGSQVRDLDILNVGQNAMVAVAKLSLATLGNTGVVYGLSATPGSGLNVVVGPGEVYQQAPLEATAISELTQDLAHTIIKQGININATTVSGFAAPGISGQSINYLIQAQYQDLDAGATVLNYFNVATYPAGLPYSGPGNTATAQTTVRKGIVALQVKAGSAATTGTQTTPSPDSGWIGLYAVTVAYGNASIASGQIATYGSNGSGGPLAAIPTNLAAIPAAIQQSQWAAYQDTGVANAYVIAPTPPIATRKAGATRFLVQFSSANTSGCTLNDGLGVVPLYQNSGAALATNYITAGQVSEVVWDGSGYQMVPGPAAWVGNTMTPDAALLMIGAIS